MNPTSDQPGQGAPLPPSAVAALQRGNKIEAIKIVRTERKCDLKDAKDAVEAYIATQPALLASMAKVQRSGTAALLRWVVIIVLAGLIAYHLLGKVTAG